MRREWCGAPRAKIDRDATRTPMAAYGTKLPTGIDGVSSARCAYRCLWTADRPRPGWRIIDHKCPRGDELLGAFT
jgi:hypothetical protein